MGHMAELIAQILDIAKGIAHVFNTGIWPALIAIVKGIGTLFVRVLELTILAAKWIITKV